MLHETLDPETITYSPCRYTGSQIFFRGPKRPLTGRYLAFVGGTQTYGKYIARPYPALIEEAMGEVCVNFGCVNASVDAFGQEPAVQAACRNAVLNVVQVMGAANMSNRFYTVHPRRNDRFTRASSVLRAIYPDVDFSDFCFTRHMLGALYDRSPERFAIVRDELQAGWRARMGSFLRNIGMHTLLLWFADHLPSDADQDFHPTAPRRDPLFVTRSMIDELRPLVRGVVMVQPKSAGGAVGVGRPEMANAAAAELPGQAAHDEAAAALRGAITVALSGLS